MARTGSTNPERKNIGGAVLNIKKYMNYLRTIIWINIFFGVMGLLSTSLAATTIYYPEPFDFHYPQEKTHQNITDRLKLQATLGEYESGTFVVYSSQPATDVILRTNDLVGPAGTVIPKKNIDAGIVTFMNLKGNMAYQIDIWVGGMEAGRGRGAPYNGFNKDAKENLPLLPVCIVKNDNEFEAAKKNATGHITLTHQDNVVTSFEAGKSKQFWITVHIPENLKLPHIRNTFSGVLDLEIDGKPTRVPLEVEVLNYRLDELGFHQKYMGVMRAWDVSPEFRDAATADVRKQGCNAIRAPINSLQDYEYVKRYGFDLAITTHNNWTKKDVQQIAAMGFLPLMYGRDEPGKPPPYKAEKTILRHIALTRKIQATGGLAGTSGGYPVLKEITAIRGVKQDWWLMGMSTRAWYSKRWFTFGPRFQYMADVRRDPAKKIVRLQGTYEGTMNAHYPLLTRILYGFWLFNSNFDMGIHWGYAYRSRKINPYRDDRVFMVAFPAMIKDNGGSLIRREMIHSYTWDAFREAIDDFKYALTANRLIDNLQNIETKAALRSEFDAILSKFVEIDVNNEHKIRIDAYNGYAGTRKARERLIDILAKILSE